MPNNTHTYGFDVEKGSSATSIGSTENKWMVNGAVKEIVQLTVDLSSANGTKTISDSRITDKHVVLESVVCDPIGRNGV